MVREGSLLGDICVLNYEIETTFNNLRDDPSRQEVNSKCQGSKAAGSLYFLRDRQKAIVAGV